ncbi:SHOCT domain-containing protein [Kitasatospora nipponensis]|uniref:SHOCT domain-containing protein n=1 Tax=Kitasatospora nipponensis TaxID=258049 RepID=A0ABN1WJ96_9ACTN
MNYPLLDIFWTMLWFFLWIVWIMLLFKIISDVFRSDDLGGWGKACWLFLVIVLPFLGVLIYLIARGSGMTRREAKLVQQHEEEVKAYIRDTAATTPADHADQLAKLADLKDKGALTEEEYRSAKAKVLG